MDPTLTEQRPPRPLSELLEDGRPWPVAQCLRLVRLLAFQVRSLHEGGRTHRAIDADAVAVDDQFRPQLAAGPHRRRFGGEDSDPQFCPPELAEGGGLELPESTETAAEVLAKHGHELDPRRIDIYQLGVLLCRLLTGEPIHAYMYRPKVKAAVPAAAQPLLERALGYDAQNRFDTCDRLLEALDEALQDSGSEPVSSFARATPPRGSAVGVTGDTPPQGHRAPNPPGDVTNPPEKLPFERLGRYRILARIGSGGMGDVYRGYDESLDRTVAVKVLPAELAKHADFVERFRAEATAAAKIAHPNVVPIFSIDEDAGHHFFAMQYVEGESLAARLDRHKRLAVEDAVRLIEQCLAGLEAAHNAGLIHRDIKPGNILLDRVTGRALLVDFGLVRRMGQSERLTATGVIMGTVDYIAPEQARGHPVDGRADLYALGVLFYQVLSGRLPFEADTPTAMIFQHAYEDPRPLDEVAPEAPPPILAIVARMMAKRPQERYQTAREVSADLAAFREGRPLAVGAVAPSTEPTRALDEEPRPDEFEQLTAEGLWRRARDWAATVFRRHAPEIVQRLQTTTQQIELAVGYHERRCRHLERLSSEAQKLLADLSVQLDSNREAAAALAREADAAAAEAEREAALTKKQRVEDDIAALEAQHAEQCRHSEDIELQLGKARASLARLRSQQDLLQARLRVAQARIQLDRGRPKRSLLKTVARIVTVAIGGTLIVLAVLDLWPSRPPSPSPPPGPAPTMSIQNKPGQFEPTKGSLGEAVINLEANPACLAMTPVHTFAVGNEDGTIEFLKFAPNGGVSRLVPLYAGLERPTSIVFSRDAKWFATTHKDGTTRIWETSGGPKRRELRRFRGSGETVRAVQFSADGGQILVASLDGMLRLWDVLTETEVKTSKLHEMRRNVFCLDWSRDGTRVLIGAGVYGEQSMSVWNLLEDHEEVVCDTNKLGTLAIAFSRSEDQAYSLIRPSIYVHDLASGNIVRKLGTDLSVAAFSPSTCRAWSADRNHVLTLWDLRRGEAIQTFTGHGDKIRQVAIAVDGAKALSASVDGIIRVWDLPPAPPPENQLQVLAVGSPVACVAFVPDGTEALIGTSQEMALWSVGSAPRKQQVFPSVAPVGAVVLSADGRQFLYNQRGSVGKEGFVALRQISESTVRDQRQFKAHQGQPTDAAMSFDGTRAVTGGADGSVCVWDIQSGQQIDKLDVGKPVNAVAISRSGAEILIGANDKSLRLWNFGTTKKVDLLEGHASAVLRVAFSADGKRAASAGADGTVRVWDVASRKPLAKLEGHTRRMHAAAISDHGMTVLSGGDDATVRLWDVTSGKEVRCSEGHLGPVRSVAISPDGMRALSAGDDGTARVWQLPVMVQ